MAEAQRATRTRRRRCTITSEIEAHILALEERMAQANCEGDGEFYRSQLADDAVAIASFGIFDKDAIVQQVTENRNPFTRIQMENPSVRVLTEGSALVTYTAHIDAVRDDQPFSFSVYATSVWKRAGDRWLSVLYQVTPVQPRSEEVSQGASGA